LDRLTMMPFTIENLSQVEITELQIFKQLGRIAIIKFSKESETKSAQLPHQGTVQAVVILNGNFSRNQ